MHTLFAFMAPTLVVAGDAPSELHLAAELLSREIEVQKNTEQVHSPKFSVTAPWIDSLVGQFSLNYTQLRGGWHCGDTSAAHRHASKVINDVVR